MKKENKKLEPIKMSDFYFALGIISSGIFLMIVETTGDCYYLFGGIVFLIIAILSQTNKWFKEGLDYEKQKNNGNHGKNKSNNK